MQSTFSGDSGKITYMSMCVHTHNMCVREKKANVANGRNWRSE